MSKIRISDTAVLSIQVESVQFTFWSNVFRYLCFTEHSTLLTVGIGVISIQTRENKSLYHHGKYKGEFDSAILHSLVEACGISPRHLNHPMWSHMRQHLPLLRCVIRIVKFLTINVSTVQLEHFTADSITARHLAKSGNIHINTIHCPQSEELKVQLQLFQDKDLYINYEENAVIVRCKPTRINVSMPYSGCAVGLSPLPHCVQIFNEGLSFHGDFDLCVGLYTRQCNPLQYDSDPATISEQDKSKIMKQIDPMYPVLSLMELIPQSILLEVDNCSLSMEHRSAKEGHEKMFIEVEKLLLKVCDPHTKLSTSQSNIASIYRNTSVRLRQIRFQLTPSFVTLHESVTDILRLEQLKVQVKVKAALLTEDDRDNIEHGKTKTKKLTALIVRANVESEEIAVTVVKEIAIWVSAAEKAISKMDKSIVSSLSYQPVSSMLLDIQIQYKLSKIAILLYSIDTICNVFPENVPDTHIHIDEIVVFTHPLVLDKSIGQRAIAEIQCSRIQLFYAWRERLTRKSFFSLDVSRLLMYPQSISLAASEHFDSDVELEAERLEIKWSPQCIHAVGGMIELVYTIASPFLQSPNADIVAVALQSQHQATIPMMRTIDSVVQSMVDPANNSAFRAIIKHILVIFPYEWQHKSYANHISAQSFALSVGLNAAPFAIKLSQVELLETATKSSSNISNFNVHRPPRFSLMKFRNELEKNTKGVGNATRKLKSGDGKLFYVRSFALEEIQLPHSCYSVIDIYVDHVWTAWNLGTLLRITDLIRQVTYSVWEMLYRIRKAYASTSDTSFKIPMDDFNECKRQELMLCQIISASGDKLHRLYATDVIVDAHVDVDTNITLKVGVFAGYDMPDLWEFHRVSLSLKSFQFVYLKSMTVRHTIDKLDNHVYGYFEEMLRLRKQLTGRSNGNERKDKADGILLSVEGLSLSLNVTLDIPNIIQQSEEIMEDIKVSAESLAHAYWRPQETIFAQYFLEDLKTSQGPNIWLELHDTRLKCLDDPFETWLLRIHPIWMEILQQKEIMLSKMEMSPCDTIVTEDEESMISLARSFVYSVHKANEIYAEKEKKATHSSIPSNRGELLSCNISFLGFDCGIQHGADDGEHIVRMAENSMKVLDSLLHKEQHDHSNVSFEYSCILTSNIMLKIEGFQVKLRNDIHYLLSVAHLSTSGDIALVQRSCTGNSAGSIMKLHINQQLEVRTPIIHFIPKQMHAISKLIAFAERAQPNKAFFPDRSISDILCKQSDAKLKLEITDVSVYLQSLENPSEYTCLQLQRCACEYADFALQTHVHRLALKIVPDTFSEIIELSYFAGKIECKRDNDTWEIQLMAKLNPNELFEIDTEADVSACVKREMASQTRVIVYTDQLEMVLAFYKSYEKEIERYHITNICRSGRKSNDICDKFWACIISSVKVSSFQVSGVDAAMYKSQMQHIGIRAFMREGIHFSAEFEPRTGEDDGNAYSRLHILPWKTHMFELRIEDIEVRMCTLQSGSRGEPFFSLKKACVQLNELTKSQALAEHTAVSKSNKMQIFCTKSVKEISHVTKNILDHFAIPQHNPFQFRNDDEALESNLSPSSAYKHLSDDNDQNEFCISVSLHEIRLLVTVGGLETLLECIDSGMEIYSDFSNADLYHTATYSVAKEQSNIFDVELYASAKRSMTLSEDPKYHAILQGEPLSAPSDANDAYGSPSLDQEFAAETTAFFLFSFHDCQINFQDLPHMGSTLLAMHHGSLQMFVSTDRRDALLHIKVADLEALSAPLDVDVTSKVSWIRFAPNDSYASAASGLYCPVLAPMTIQMKLRMQSMSNIMSKELDIQIDTVQANIDVTSKEILLNLIQSIQAIIASKATSDQQIQSLCFAHAKRAAKIAQVDFRSTEDMGKLMRQQRWYISYLRWLHSSQWDFERENDTSTRYGGLAIERSRETSSSSRNDTFITDLQRFMSEHKATRKAVHMAINRLPSPYQTASKLRCKFALQSLILRLSAAHSDIVQMRLKEIAFSMQRSQDQSASCSLTLETLSCSNLCPGTLYTELLLPFTDTEIPSDCRHFLSMNAEVARPMEEMHIIQHFEINIHPIQLCITQDVVVQLAAFFSNVPENKASQINRAQHIRSQFLSLTTPNKTEALEKLRVPFAFQKAARLATKAAAEGFQMSKEYSKEAKWRNVSSSFLKNEIQTDTVANSESLLEEEELMDFSEAIVKPKLYLFKRIRIGILSALVTYKNKKSSQQPLEEMRGFEIKIHALVYCDKTCSLLNLLQRIRRDVVLDVLSQVGRNFTNIGTFLRDRFNISRYANFEALAPLKTRTNGNNEKKKEHLTVKSQFQLELPGNHPSLRDKRASSSVRLSERALSYKNSQGQEQSECEHSDHSGEEVEVHAMPDFGVLSSSNSTKSSIVSYFQIKRKSAKE